MKKFVLTTLVGMFLIVSGTVFGANKDAVTGVWYTPKKDVKIEIFRKGNKYFGKVVWLEDESERDVKNPNPKLRSRKLLGINLIHGFVYENAGSWKKGKWGKGKIYNPVDGKTYACFLELKKNNLLKVTGYVGLVIFSETEWWTRAE